MVNKLTLQQKLTDIKQQQEQTIANLHALQGAEQMLQLLIADLGVYATQTYVQDEIQAAVYDVMEASY